MDRRRPAPPKRPLTWREQTALAGKALLFAALGAVAAIGLHPGTPVTAIVRAVRGDSIETLGTTRCTAAGAFVWIRTTGQTETDIALTASHEGIHAARCLRLGWQASDSAYGTPAGQLDEEAEAYGRSLRGAGYTAAACEAYAMSTLEDGYSLVPNLPLAYVRRVVRHYCGASAHADGTSVTTR